MNTQFEQSLKQVFGSNPSRKPVSEQIETLQRRIKNLEQFLPFASEGDKADYRQSIARYERTIEGLRNE